MAIKSAAELKVLVLDDSGFARRMMIRDLLESGLKEENIVETESGEQALQMIAQQTFDLFVLDIVLNGIDGIKVLREIKTLQPAAKVVMCSGNNALELVKETVALGAAAYIVKPHKPEVFIPAIRRVLELPLRENDPAWRVKCHKCDCAMIEMDSIDMVGFFCPNGCMTVGPLSPVLLRQAELDEDYERAVAKRQA